MIIKPLITVNVDPVRREERLKALLAGQTVAPENHTGGRVLAEHDGFLFERLSVAGKQYDFFLPKALLDGKKDQSSWWSYAQATPDVVLPNGVILYQMMHRLYSLRNDLRQQGAGALAVQRDDWAKNYPHLGTRIDYIPGNLEATIQHLQPDKTVSALSLTMPVFTPHESDPNWSYLVLAKEQPESKLGTKESLPPGAWPVLQGLLGAHAEEVGAVCQYVSPRKDGNMLREVRLWVPGAQSRKPRALVLGVNGNGRFVIYASGNINDNRPARGVAVRKKYST